MSGNTFGKLLKLTTFGESHGEALGGIIDGCPAGLKLDFDFINSEMQRRKPGQSSIVTQRKEEDEVQFLSGIFQGKTTQGQALVTTNQENTSNKSFSSILRQLTCRISAQTEVLVESNNIQNKLIQCQET